MGTQYDTEVVHESTCVSIPVSETSSTAGPALLFRYPCSYFLPSPSHVLLSRTQKTKLAPTPGYY